MKQTSARYGIFVSIGVAVFITVAALVLWAPTASAADTGYHVPSANINGIQVCVWHDGYWSGHPIYWHDGYTECTWQDQWDNPENAYSSDNHRTVADSSSDVVKYYNFDLGVPTDADSINGIEVQIEGYTNGSRQTQISLSWNGGDTYTSGSGIKTTNMPGTHDYNETTRTLGGVSDTWNRTWSASDFSDGHFRVKLDATSGGGSRLYIDRVMVRVTYTPHNLTTGSLVIHKVINGGDLRYGDFSVAVDGGTPKAFDIETGNAVFADLATGSHTIVETPVNGYTSAFGDTCPNGLVTVTAGNTVNCTVTNTVASQHHRPGNLVVQNVVHGGVLGLGDFQFNFEGVNTFEPDGTNEYERLPDIYQVSAVPATGYEASYGGDCDEAGNVTVQPDTTVTCVITNTAADWQGVGPVLPGAGSGAGTGTETGNGTGSGTTGGEGNNEGGVLPAVLVVQKIIVGASVSYSEFSFSIGTKSFQFDPSGENFLTIGSGQYSIVEDARANYKATYGGDCSPEGKITVHSAETKTCIITNTYVEPVQTTPPPPPAPIIRHTPTPTPVVSEEPSPTASAGLEATIGNTIDEGVLTRFWHWIKGLF